MLAICFLVDMESWIAGTKSLSVDGCFISDYCIVYVTLSMIK